MDVADFFLIGLILGALVGYYLGYIIGKNESQNERFHQLLADRQSAKEQQGKADKE